MSARVSTDRVGLESAEAHLAAKLVEAGVSEVQVGAARSFHRQLEGRQPLSRTVVELGLASDEAVARWIAAFHGLRYVAPGELIPRGNAHLAIAEPIARNRFALAIERREERLLVAVADPCWPQFAQVEYALEGFDVEWVVSPLADIGARIAESYAGRLDVSDNELERFVEDMIRQASHARGVSDIHCIPEDRSCEIRWRVDGDLVPWGTLPGSMRDAFSAQVKLSSTRGPDGRSRASLVGGGLDVANRLDPQDASSFREYGSKRVSLRYSVIPAINGESIVIRILDQSAQVGTLEDLGMLEDTAIRFRSALRRPNGIVLVAGPTGHGKSTTLAAAIPSLDARNRRVLSVEDPVEYRLRSVTQVPVGPRMPFSTALRAFLRHNPDILIVGEIRDAETAALAVRLALTGHLILSTVHANSAVQSISRLIDLGVEPSMMAATGRLLLAQRLVKRLCPHCRRPHRNASLYLERHAGVIGLARRPADHPQALKPPGGFFEAGGGCAACSGTGFHGRLGIFEWRDLCRPLAEMLRLQRGHFDATAAEGVFAAALGAGDPGARSMREDGILKALEGRTTPEEVYGATAEGPGAPA